MAGDRDAGWGRARGLVQSAVSLPTRLTSFTTTALAIVCDALLASRGPRFLGARALRVTGPHGHDPATRFRDTAIVVRPRGAANAIRRGGGGFGGWGERPRPVRGADALGSISGIRHVAVRCMVPDGQ